MSGAPDPLVYEPGDVEAARKVALLIPGALARIAMFAPAEKWRAQGYALVYYRFPGLDGLPLAPELDIEGAAAHVAAFCVRHPGKQFYLLGYSTGGPIAIRAAERIGGDVRVAAMSSAVQQAGGLVSAGQIARDVLAAAAQARSARRNVVWLAYFKQLLFGRAVLQNSALDAQAAKLLAAHLPDMIYPDPPLLAAHSDALRRWTLPKGQRLASDRLAFFSGAADPVFSPDQTATFAAHFGAPASTLYPGHGHLLFMTHPAVFDDVLAFFERK
ncbi:MAG: alpha/beta hydrolase [Pseudomonadota bacterium]